MKDEPDRRFGWAWLMFAISVACHVMDEAAHDFLSVYNPNALWLRARFHLPFPPIFTFREWLIGLTAAVLLLVCLTPFALRGSRVLRIVAVPLGIVVGIGNGLGHIASSFYYHRLMPGVISGPLIIATGMLLVLTVWRRKVASRAVCNTLTECITSSML